MGRGGGEIDWIEPAKKVFDPAMGLYGRWFVGGVLNTCYNALDRHVEARPRRTARADLRQPGRRHDRTLHLSEMLDEVARSPPCWPTSASAKGDRVIIYMPMVPEAVDRHARLRAASARCIPWCSAASRRRNWRPASTTPSRRLILSASCGIEPGRVVALQAAARPGDRAVERTSPTPCLILQRPQVAADSIAGRDHDWAEACKRPPRRQARRLRRRSPATDPLYILYTSGTTGMPKGVVRDNGGHVVALKWTMQNLYGVEPGEVYWAASDVGWVVGHSYIVYAPLLHGATSVMYEGKPIGTPDAGAFWRVIAEHKVDGACSPRRPRSAPSSKEDPEGELLPQIRPVEASAPCSWPASAPIPPTVQWAEGS